MLRFYALITALFVHLQHSWSLKYQADKGRAGFNRMLAGMNMAEVQQVSTGCALMF
jgi:hypothetical protein